jgi:integrase
MDKQKQQNAPHEPRISGPLADPLTLNEAIGRYMLSYKGRDRSRVQRLAYWQAQLGHCAIVDIDDDLVFHHLQQIAAAPARLYAGVDADGRDIHRSKATARTPATCNRYRDALSSVLAWTIAERLAPKGWENPVKKIKKRRESQGVVRYLDEDERTRLLSACRASRWPRLYGLVLTALCTGARRGEVARLRWDDIDLDRGLARCRTTKNGEPRILPLTKAVRAELSAFRAIDAKRFKATSGEPLVFHSERKPDVPFNFDGPWKAALKAADVKKFRIHDLRHSCASLLAQSGASLLEISDVLGHKSLSMVQRYAHLCTKSKAALVDRVLGDIS